MAEERATQQDTQSGLLPFDPIVTVMDVLRRWYLVAAAALIAAMGVFAGTELSYRPEYATTTTFVVSLRESSSSVYQNLSATSSLALAFSEVLNSSLLRREVEQSLDGRPFDGHIEAAAVAETNLLTMRVTAGDPRTAFLAARAVIERHQAVSYQVMGDIILEVLQQPKVPTAPSNPLQAGSNAKKAALLAAAAASVLLALCSLLRDAVRSGEEAGRKLDCRVLVQLRHERKNKTLRAALRRRKGGILITSPLVSFSYTETVRTLRRRVEQHMPEGGKALLVTSALENEGKSTVAVNLALSLAQKRRRVLLLDCDLRKPACCQILGQEWQGDGTAQAAQGGLRLDRAVRPYALGQTLDLLLQSHAVDNSAEIAASEGMAALIDAARAQYDYVVVDTPPMSAGLDAECLADLADASILVVRQNYAGTSLLCSALDVLHAARAEVLGCVLNDCRSSLLTSQGSYGYGYGRYGYGRYGYGRYGAYAVRASEREDDR